jgi:aryl-alcohol dehydrogenase-like predicted oxidoreductase
VRDAERELLPALEAYGLGLLPYFPLASGLLTGKYKRTLPPPQGARLAQARYADRYFTEANWTRVERLEEFCARGGRTLLELAFAWLLSRPVLASVIAGATKPEQVEANVRAAAWSLSADDLAEIDRLAAQA